MGKNKGTGNGTIYFDKTKQKWFAQTNYYDPVTNHLRKKTKIFNSQKEAQDYMNALKYQQEDPIYIKNNGIPLIEVMKARVNRKLETNIISEQQYYRTLATLKQIEKCYLADLNIEEITTRQIQDYFNSLITKYSDSTIKKFLEQFRQAFNYAENKGYITKNPMVDFIKPKSKKKTKIVRALTTEEESQFVEYLLNQDLKSCPYKNVFLIQLFMGLRIGEVLALKKSDIDLVHNILSVERTLTTGENAKPVMGNTTKTYAGIREIPIPLAIKPYLIEQIEESYSHPDHLLFTTKNNNLVDEREVNLRMKELLKKEFGITGVSTHSLRHTFGTRCVESGMRAVVIQRLMGHKDVSVTLNTYTSVFNKYKKSELESLNDYYIKNAVLPSKTIEKLEETNPIIIESNSTEEENRNEKNIENYKNEKTKEDNDEYER